MQAFFERREALLFWPATKITTVMLFDKSAKIVYVKNRLPSAESGLIRNSLQRKLYKKRDVATPLFVCHCIRNGLAYIPFHSTLLFLIQGAYSSSKRRVMFFRLWPTSALGKMAWAWGRNSFGLSMAGL